MGASIVETDGHYLVSWAEETNVINHHDKQAQEAT
jgi:hypothetical protein